MYVSDRSCWDGLIMKISCQCFSRSPWVWLSIYWSARACTAQITNTFYFCVTSRAHRIHKHISSACRSAVCIYLYRGSFQLSRQAIPRFFTRRQLFISLYCALTCKFLAPPRSLALRKVMHTLFDILCDCTKLLVTEPSGCLLRSLSRSRERRRDARNHAFAILINAKRDVKRENCSSFWAAHHLDPLHGWDSLMAT